MTANRRVTISISIPSVVHLILGIILAIAAVAAFLIHLDLPRESVYRPTVASAGVIAAFATISYWLWCCIQRSRTETNELHDMIVAAVEEVREHEEASRVRDEAILAALNGIVSTLTELAGDIAANGGGIKELADAMDESTGAVVTLQAAINAAAANVKVLQDLYLREGQVLVFPETSDTPRDIVLSGAEKERPGPKSVRAFPSPPLACNSTASICTPSACRSARYGLQMLYMR